MRVPNKIPCTHCVDLLTKFIKLMRGNGLGVRRRTVLKANEQLWRYQADAFSGEEQYCFSLLAANKTLHTYLPLLLAGHVL